MGLFNLQPLLGREGEKHWEREGFLIKAQPEDTDKFAIWTNHTSTYRRKGGNPCRHASEEIIKQELTRCRKAEVQP